MMKNKGGQQQVFLVIVNEQKVKYSTLKSNTPKMYNAMKEIAEKYSNTFDGVFSVKRVIQSRDGKIKFV